VRWLLIPTAEAEHLGFQQTVRFASFPRLRGSGLIQPRRHFITRGFCWVEAQLKQLKCDQVARDFEQIKAITLRSA
jgi:hypothetical protein